MSRFLLLFVIFLFTSVGAIAQQLITSFSVEEGLPQSTVTALYRDNDGYLWCGTGGGLALYDGWEFHRPQSSGEKANPNLNSIVRGIIPSSDLETVWVGSESVVMQFDRYTYRLLRSFDVVKKPGVGEVPVFANDTALWLVCWGHGLYRVRINDGKVTQITKNSMVDNYGMLSDNQTVMFPDTTGNIVIYNVVTGRTSTIKRPAETLGSTVSTFVSLPGSPDDALMLTSNGLWKVSTVSQTITRYSLGDKSIDDTQWDFRTMAVHPDGSWWFGVMDRGVYRYDPVRHFLRPCFWQQDGTYAGDLMKTPKSMICDAYGVVWLGTDGAGLLKLLHNRVAFKNKFISHTITDTCNWFVRSFYELSRGRYLVGTFRNGIHLVDETANTITHVTSGPLWTQTTPHFITESGDGRLLIGTESSLLLLDTTTWVTQSIVTSNPQEPQKFIGYVRLQSGEIWVYGNTGSQRVIPGATPSLIPVGEKVNITSGIQLKDGRILFATYYRGLEEITPTGVFVRFYDYVSDVGIDNTTMIHGMVEDQNGQVWMGSESGLLQLDTQMKLTRTLTTDQGLADNTIYELVKLSDASIAVGTGHGVTLYNISTEQTHNFGGADGLPSEECNTGALFFSANGMLYIGTTGGFVAWNPLDAQSCYRSASILASYGENEPEATGIIRESIMRDYGSGSVELRLWLTDFSYPDQAIYSYHLEGSDAGRMTEKGLRKVNYAALGSGFYSFLCEATIPGCESTGLMKLLTIKVIPPFWMSGWFIGISSMGVVVIITLILFVIMRMNYQRKIRKMKMLQELDKVRQRISRDIHDEIGAGLTRIALSGDLMSQKVSSGEVSAEKLKWIAGTARELSQSMKEVVWSVNPHYDSLDHMAAYFRSYVSGVAENADVRFVYRAPDHLPALEVNPETRRNLLLIVKEAVSNSVKYSKCTELFLEIAWEHQKFTMTIGDNGSGFDLNADGKINSNGIRNIRQRAEASGCIVTFKTAPDKGTVIIITGPIGDKTS